MRLNIRAAGTCSVAVNKDGNTATLTIIKGSSDFFVSIAPLDTTCTKIYDKYRYAAVAQSVEQWTENPCVLGSTPRGTTPPFISPVL